MISIENEIKFGYTERFNLEQSWPINEAWTTRKSFWCLYAVIAIHGKFAKEVKRQADMILNNLNAGGANTSLKRSPEIIEADNLSGILAEKVCELYLSDRYGADKVKRIQSNISINQIDLMILDKTIEIRSSCIRNGIDFALFKRDDKDLNKQYGDIIGPYKNGYKPGETQKDYYLRVIYHIDINDFLSHWNNKQWIGLYITGGATKNMMNDSAIYQIKHLKPESNNVEIESDYRTIPFGRSLDFIDFIKTMEYENVELFFCKHSTCAEWFIQHESFRPE